MKKLVATTLLAALAAATVASAQVSASAAPVAAAGNTTAAAAPAAPRAASPAGKAIERILAPLGLTSEQQASVAALRERFETATEDLRADLRARTSELFELRKAAGADPAAVQTKRDELAAVQATMRVEVDKLAGEISAVLDPDQRVRFESGRSAMQSSRPAGERRPSPGSKTAVPAAQSETPPPAGG
jgi:Spy/CpxP family protein refolding chaperone